MLYYKRRKKKTILFQHFQPGLTECTSDEQNIFSDGFQPIKLPLFILMEKLYKIKALQKENYIIEILILARGDVLNVVKYVIIILWYGILFEAHEMIFFQIFLQ